MKKTNQRYFGCPSLYIDIYSMLYKNHNDSSQIYMGSIPLT